MNPVYKARPDTASGWMLVGSPKQMPIFTRGPEKSSLPSSGAITGRQDSCCRMRDVQVARSSAS